MNAWITCKQRNYLKSEHGFSISIHSSLGNISQILPKWIFNWLQLLICIPTENAHSLRVKLITLFFRMNKEKVLFIVHIHIWPRTCQDQDRWYLINYAIHSRLQKYFLWKHFRFGEIGIELLSMLSCYCSDWLEICTRTAKPNEWMHLSFLKL